MKSKIKYLMLALVAVFACVSFSSCDAIEEDLLGVYDYYYQLSGVQSNCFDANGNDISSACKEEWKTIVNADGNYRIKVGKTTNEKAVEWFNMNIDANLKAYDELYAGKNLLPEGGWVVYTFRLFSDSPKGVTKSASIEVSNSGARLL